MPCNKPLQGWYAKVPNEATGKRPVVFNSQRADYNRPIKVPCGKCLGCLQKRSREWAIRCVHESRLYDENVFLTLTYHPKYYPRDLMLHKEHFQKFMKRLRKKYKGRKIRYLHCGEYGSKTFRAHYHALLFNMDFKDKEVYKRGKNNDVLFHSNELDAIWKKGMCLIGEVSFASAQYVAKYINKPQEHVEILEKKEGFKRAYNTSSRRPGVGIPYLEKYWTDIYPNDYCIMDGGKYKPPRAYDKWIEKNQPDIWRAVKKDRMKRLAEYEEGSTSEEKYDRNYAREKAMATLSGTRDVI